MTRLKMVAALLMCCLISACGTDIKRVAEFIPTPPERLVCEAAGARPAVPKEYVIDWRSVTTVAQARAEHEKFVGVLRNSQGIIAGYILRTEGKLFTCFTNVQWRREFEARLKKAQP